ncbi:MAG: PQQ-dependent sugar dehydrogenase [Ilumatobacter sp.]|nr:PQQ-dependent sugar dehydrogenase [Ilumatobacter sp.]
MRRSLGALCATVVVLAACGDDGAPDDESSAVIVTTTTTVAPDATPTSAAPTVTESTTESTTTASPAPTTDALAPDVDPPPSDPTVGEPTVTTELVVETDRPVDLAVRPGDAALHLVNQSGTVVRFDPATGSSTVTLDVSGLISSGGEQGLLGLEFSADGAHAYTNHTAADGTTTVTEYAVGADGVLDPASARVLLEVAQPYSNHNAGDLALGPDGYLYVPLGDGGAAGDPERRAGDPTSLLGSLLRIDPTPTADAPYSIPSDNPFVGGSFAGVEGAAEVWSWGLRNPWKIAFDPANGDLWIADVGQNRVEEIDVVSPTGDLPAGYGANFGWSAYEGNDRFNDDVADPGNLVFPVLTYEHSTGGCSISGGAVYRGSAVPGLEPAYVYSDYCAGTVWALDLAGQRNLTLVDGLDTVVAVRRGPDGELYVVQASGAVSRIIPA